MGPGPVPRTTMAQAHSLQDRAIGRGWEGLLDPHVSLAGLQLVLGAHDLQLPAADQVCKQRVSGLERRDTAPDVRSGRLIEKLRLGRVPYLFDRWDDGFDEGTDVARQRLALDCYVNGRVDRPTLVVPEDHHENGAELGRSVLDAANDERIARGVPGHAH